MVGGLDVRRPVKTWKSRMGVSIWHHLLHEYSREINMSDQNHFDEERIINAVLSFVNARDMAESKAIMQAHQDDLLTPAADQIFEAMLMQYKDDEKARRILEDRRSLLLRCQSEGIDAAFADRLKARSISDIPPELLARLRSIRTDAELRELIEEHPELLPVIQQIVTQSQAPQGRSTDVSGPDELPALLQELQELNRLSDMPRRVELCQTALGLVDRDAQPELWAGLQVELGNSLAQNPLGPRAENLGLAIDPRTTWLTPTVTASAGIEPRTLALQSTTTIRH
jgi:hypothetical protein